MLRSRFRSVALPVTPSGTAVRVAQATSTPVRVVVAISGPAGSIGFVAFNPGSLNPVSNNFVADGYAVGAGSDVTLVVAPGQVLYAVGNLAGMSLSAAESEAMPLESGTGIGVPGSVSSAPRYASVGGPQALLQVQAQGGPIEVSYNNSDWIIIPAGKLLDLRAVGSTIYARAAKRGDSISILGTNPDGAPFQVSAQLPGIGEDALEIPLGDRPSDKAAREPATTRGPALPTRYQPPPARRAS